MEPIEFLDKLVKGVILVTYDFLKLTCAGFTIPLVRHRPLFWRAVISLEGRISSLTYLVVWCLLATSIAFDFGPTLIAEATGFEKGTKRTSPSCRRMPAFGVKADESRAPFDVCL